MAFKDFFKWFRRSYFAKSDASAKKTGDTSGTPADKGVNDSYHNNPAKESDPRKHIAELEAELAARQKNLKNIDELEDEISSGTEELKKGIDEIDEFRDNMDRQVFGKQEEALRIGGEALKEIYERDKRRFEESREQNEKLKKAMDKAFGKPEDVINKAMEGYWEINSTDVGEFFQGNLKSIDDAVDDSKQRLLKSIEENYHSKIRLYKSGSDDEGESPTIDEMLKIMNKTYHAYLKAEIDPPNYFMKDFKFIKKDFKKKHRVEDLKESSAQADEQNKSVKQLAEKEPDKIEEETPPVVKKEDVKEEKTYHRSDEQKQKNTSLSPVNNYTGRSKKNWKSTFVKLGVAAAIVASVFGYHRLDKLYDRAIEQNAELSQKVVVLQNSLESALSRNKSLEAALKALQSSAAATNTANKTTDTNKTNSLNGPYETVVVKKGSYLWKEAKDLLIRKGVKNPTNKQVLDITDKIAVLNGKYTIGQAEKLKSSGKKIPRQKDPNYVVAGSRIKLPVINPKASKTKGLSSIVNESRKGIDYSTPSSPVFTGVLNDSNVVGNTIDRKKKGEEQSNAYSLEDRLFVKEPVVDVVVDEHYLLPAPSNDYESTVVNIIKDKNNGLSLKNISEKYSLGGIDSVILAIKDYQNRPFSVDEKPLINRFDKRVASEALLSAIVDDYQHSDKTLKELKKDYEARFNQRISESTISKYARLLTGFNNRREARSHSQAA